MTATHSAHRWHRIAAALVVLLVAASCASRPSLGPKTETGQPAHVDAGPGQLLRYCETLHDRGKLPMAAAMCERAYQLDPTNPEPLLELASILGDMGEIELAKRTYTAILTDLPGHAGAHYGLGRIHLSAGQYDLALTEFQAGLRSDPKDPRLYNAAGVASGMLGTHAAAQNIFRAGLKVAPDDMRLRNNLGLSLIQSGHYDDGLKMLQAAAKDPAAGKANRENLDLALGVAAAARAEAVLAETRARLEAESAAQAEAQNQAPPVAEPAPMASEDSMGAAEIPAESPPAEMSAVPVQAEMPGGSPPAENFAETAAAQLHGPTPADETMDEVMPEATPVEISEPTPLLSTLIAESTADKQTTPSGRANNTDEDPWPPIRSWTQRAQADITVVPDSDVGDRSDAAPLPSTERNAAKQKADSAKVADAWTMDDTIDQTAEEPGHGRLGDDFAQAADEAMAEATGEAVAKPAEQVTVLSNVPGPGRAPGPGPAPKTTSAGSHAVQLASYTSEDRAWRGWSLLQEDAADILGNVKPTVRGAYPGGAQYIVYRLRTEPSPKADAQRLCEDLKARGIACLVVKSEASPSEKDAPKGAATP